MLYKPVIGERLWLHLAVGEGAISLILLCQEGAVQHPIFFISHLLKDAEGGTIIPWKSWP